MPNENEEQVDENNERVNEDSEQPVEDIVFDIVLASASPRRKQLLEDLSLP